MRLGKRQRALLHVIQVLGSVSVRSLPPRELDASRRLYERGLLRCDQTDDDWRLAPVLPWKLTTDARRATCEPHDPETAEAITERIAGARARASRVPEQRKRPPILSLSVSPEAHDRLMDLGADRVRDLLCAVAEVGFTEARGRMSEHVRPVVVGRQRKVYGLAIPPEIVPEVKGQTRTGETRDLVLAALSLGWEDAIGIVRAGGAAASMTEEADLAREGGSARSAT